MKKYLLYFNIIWSVLAFLTVLVRSELSYILLIMAIPIYPFTIFAHFIWGIYDWVKTKNLSMLLGFIVVILFYILAISFLPSGFGRQ